jgi:hypothetical protein
MKKFLAHGSSLLLSVAVLLSSCKKDTLQAHGRSTALLQVALTEGYMAAGKVDSAFALWEVNGSTQIIKLQVADNMLTTSLDSFKKSGAGMLAIQLYSQIKMDNIPLLWEKRFSHTLDRSTPVRITSPAGITDPSWNPRLVYKSDIYQAEFTTIIALRPEDSYFELKGVQPAIAKRIEIMRSYYQNDTSTVVVRKGWTGQASDLDTYGNLVNRAHFQSLAGEIGGKPWNKVKVRASFYARISPVEIYEAETIHNKP